jgi:hypothetical protein
VRITRDKWVLGAPSHPIKPIIYILDDLRVSALINTTTRQWNRELIVVCFSPPDAELILKIPLSSSSVADCVSWPINKTRIFTVKSAYIMAKSEEVYRNSSNQGKGEASNHDQIAKDWKKLWSITAPPKMLTVLWRFAHDCLPTGHQLRNGNIPTSECCPHCGREENLFHTFIGCQYMTEIWREIKKKSGFKLNQAWLGFPWDWLFEFLSRCTKREATMLTIVLWHIWEARNAMRNGEADVHPWLWVKKIIAYVDMVLLSIRLI